MNKRKTVQPEVREISPVSIYGEVYGEKKFEEEVCFESRVKKRVIDGDRGGDDSVDPTCVG